MSISLQLPAPLLLTHLPMRLGIRVPGSWPHSELAWPATNVFSPPYFLLEMITNAFKGVRFPCVDCC